MSLWVKFAQFAATITSVTEDQILFGAPLP
jgi:hypothetical protein